MIVRSMKSKPQPLNIVGSSNFGIYPKINSEKTYNMYITDGFLANYMGYKKVITGSESEGRFTYSSANLNRLITVFDNNVYANAITYNQAAEDYQYVTNLIGNLETFSDPVYIAENDTGQLAIVDGQNVYIYDPNQSTPLTDTISRTAAANFIVTDSLTTFTTGMRVTFAGSSLPAPLIEGTVYFLANTALTANKYYVCATYDDAVATPTPVFIPLTTDGTGTMTQYSPVFYIIPDLGFIPTYITFHDTYFICASGGTNQWRLGVYESSAQFVHFPATLTGFLQTKPDQVQAVVRFPSGGNMIFVFGKTVVEPWFDTGGNLFPYQRNDSFNIDYGCLNAATIATLDEYVVWLGQNEKSGPVIFASNGGKPEQISTDGIDGLLYSLYHPEDAQAFLIRQNGHLFYHINFYTDNLSLFYDFNTKKFYHASDENRNYYLASVAAFFNEQYYFVSKNNGNLYAFDTQYDDYDGEQIPRVRICKPIRSPNQENFIVTDVGFTLEQGTTDYHIQNLEGAPNNPLQYAPRVDFSFSADGGQSFGSRQPYVLNTIGKYRNALRWWQCGMTNDFTAQFEFWNFGRIAASDGIANIRQ